MNNTRDKRSQKILDRALNSHVLNILPACTYDNHAISMTAMEGITNDLVEV